MRGRLVILGAAAVLTAAARFFGGAFRGGARPTADDAAAAPNTLAAAAATSPAGGLGGDTPVGGTTGQQVQQLQTELRTNPRRRPLVRTARPRVPAARPRDRRSGLLHQGRRRPAPRSGAGPERPDRDRRAGLARTLAAPLPRGPGSRPEGARASSPTTARNYGVIGDALARARPLPRGVPRLRHDGERSSRASPRTRASHTRGSCSATPPAPSRRCSSRSTRPPARREPTAWTHVQLGKLYWSTGRLDRAGARVPRRAGGVPRLRLRARRAGPGRGGARARRRAIALEHAGRDRDPAAAVRRALGDLYRADGEPRRAQQQYALIGVIERLLVANGVKTDLETALFDVDHGIRLRAVARARAAGPAPSGPVDRRRRRARLGARAQRPLRRGAAVLAARAAPRDARRAQALPPRDDRALPRPPPRAHASTSAARSRSTRTSRSSGRPSPGRRCDEAPRRPRRPRAPSLAAPAAALAHPLGNFTVNRFSRVEVSGHRLYVLYVLDMAEIPTFQAGDSDRRSRAYARRIARGAHLTVDGRPARARPGCGTRSRIPPGAGGLRTTRLEVVLARAAARRPGADRLPRRELRRPDRLEGDRRRRATRTSAQRTSSAPTRRTCSRARSTSLRVTARLAPADGPDVAAGALDAARPCRRPTASPTPASPRSSAARHLSALVILASLAASRSSGARRTRSARVTARRSSTAYLVGQRGTPRHAALLGLIVTITHTIGVFALGLVTLALSQFIVPDDLYPWLNLVSGLLVVAIGASVLLRARWRHRARACHTATTTITTTRPRARPRRPRARASARCSRSASPAGSSPAPRRSSSCWPRSRCTASPSAAPDPRLQRRARAHDHRHRARRRAREARVRARRASRAGSCGCSPPPAPSSSSRPASP